MRYNIFIINNLHPALMTNFVQPLPNIRADFPAIRQLDQNQQVYLDSAATTQKPIQLIEYTHQLLSTGVGNVHRSGHQLGRTTTQQFEQARCDIAHFIGATNPASIIWTKGTTESINLIVASWAEHQLKEGDEIILSMSEHHANLVPWQQFAQRRQVSIKWIEIGSDGHLNLAQAATLFSEKTALLAITHVSNVLGAISPLRQLIDLARVHKTRVFIDGAQAIAHLPINVSDLGCDFYAFSGHKVYGPSGIGALYVHPNRFAEMKAWQTGGEMVNQVSYQNSSFQPMPLLLEPGTPNIEGALGLACSLNYLTKLDLDNLWQQEHQLFKYLVVKCASIPNLEIISALKNNIPLLSFNIKNIHSFDVASLLDQQDVYIRSGSHCAQPLLTTLGIESCLRVSIGLYNQIEDIDRFYEALIEAIDVLSED